MHTHTNLVRQKSKEVIGFLQDDDRLRESRKTARQNRDKYVGISSAEDSNKYSEFYTFVIVRIVLFKLCNNYFTVES